MPLLLYRINGTSKVELSTDFGEPGQHDLSRLPERGVVGVLARHRVRVKQIEQVDIDRGARPSNVNDFAEPEVHLIEPLPVLGADRLTGAVGRTGQHADELSAVVERRSIGA